MKKLSFGMRVWVAVLCSAMAVPWGALSLMGADITPGYTFSSGEANVTHTKLNNSAAGTINTSFLSGKASAGSSPNTAFEILLRDTSLDTYKKTTIGALLDHSGLIDNRTVATVPALSDLWLVSQSGAYKAITVSNAAFGGTDVAVPTNDTRFGFMEDGGVLGFSSLSNLIGAATPVTVTTNGDRWLILTAGGAIAQQTAQTAVTGAPAGTNFTGTDVLLSWDGTRLRSNRATNFIDGVVITNTTIAADDAFVVLQAGVLKKLFMASLRTFVMSNAARDYVLIRQTNSSGSNGQTLTAANGWETRILNDEQADTGGVATLSANQVTLTPGVYRARITAPCHECGSHQARWAIVDSTATNTVLLGSVGNSTSVSGVTSESLMAGRFTCTTNTVFEVQHNVGDNGLGGNAGSHGQGEVYTIVELWKESD